MSGGDLTQTLWDLAISQRWFSGRSGRALRVDLGDWAAEPTPSTPGLRPGFLVVGFDDGHEETYLIPLLWPLDGEPSDATDDAGNPVYRITAGQGDGVDNYVIAFLEKGYADYWAPADAAAYEGEGEYAPAAMVASAQERGAGMWDEANCPAS